MAHALEKLYGSHLTRSPEQTRLLGQQVGEVLNGGEILLLDGTLGAGKTVFVKGIAHALRYDEAEVNSPTFTLVNKYGGERATLYHLDLYRLDEGFAAAARVDLEELLNDEAAVIVIEWAERIKGYPLPETTRHIAFEIVDETTRRITIDGTNST